MDLTDFYTTTPIRKGGYTNNITTLQPDTGVEWTTKRCERLLRALTSRVAILTKDLARFSTSIPQETSSTRRKSIPDDDWGKIKKKIKQTYSTKRKKSSIGRPTRNTVQSTDQTRSLNPGEISVPTPVLARARREYSDTEEVSLPDLAYRNVGPPRRRRKNFVLDGADSSFQISESLQEIRRKISATKYTTYEGIYSGLETLLVATAPSKPQVKRNGARSLFAMALRAVPGYIRQQESLVEAHMLETGSKSAIVRRDMATEIYDELEDLGLGHGWKHLKTVVRSHGILVLREAVTVGVLEPDYVGCLITLCTRLSATDEAQSLFSALLASKHFALPKSIHEKPYQSLFMLSRFTEHTESTTFQYRELSSLFSSGVLPIEWCATRHFGQIWAGFFHTLSSGLDNFEALAFLNTLLPLIAASINIDLGTKYAAISEALQNTLSSVLTTLSSIIILGDQNHTLGETTSGLSRSVSTSLQHCSTIVQGEVEDVGILPILSTIFAMSLSDAQTTSTLAETLLTQLEQNKRHDLNSYSQAVSFTCAVARCCGRGSSTPGFEHLQYLHSILEHCNKHANANIIKSLIVDSAFSFAEQIPERDHLQYAAAMDNKFCVRRLDTGSGSQFLLNQGKQRSGYRWEEGIGEWVTASPLVARRIAMIVPVTEVECDTPYRPEPIRRSRVEVVLLSSPRVASRPVVEISYDSSVVLEDYDILLDCGSEQDIGISEHDNELAPESSQLSCIDADSSFMSTASSSSDSKLVLRAHQPKRATRANRKSTTNTSDWTTHDDSAISLTSPETSRTAKAVIRRTSTRLSRTSQAFNVQEDDSDDELSFISASLTHENKTKALREVTNTSANTRGACKRKGIYKAGLQTKRAVKRRRVVDSESEDELCL